MVLGREQPSARARHLAELRSARQQVKDAEDVLDGALLYRVRAVREASAAGLSGRAIALELGLSPQRIAQILRIVAPTR